MLILGGSHGSVIVRQMVIYGQHIYCLLVNHLLLALICYENANLLHVFRLFC